MNDYSAAREAMVDCQVRPSDVTQYAIIDSLLTVPREVFVSTARRDVAYAEADIPLDDGRALMAPRTFAKMLEVAAIGADDLVLDVAPGTGYSTAVIARLAAAVVAVEPHDGMRAHLQEAISRLEVDNAIVSEETAVDGDPSHGPYDVIFVNGAVEAIPDALMGQLKDGGRLVAIFLEDGVGQCRVLVRAGDSVTDRFAFNATAPILAGFQMARSFAF